MYISDILGILGGLIVTVVLVAFVILLLKIIRAVVVKGVQNKPLPREDGSEDEDESGGDIHGSTISADDNRAVGDVNDGDNSVEFWANVHSDNILSYPSPARLVKSTDPDAYVIRSSAGNKNGVYSANGFALTINYVFHENRISEKKDPRLFIVHYFDLAHFEPDDKEKPVDRRKKMYVVFESVLHRGAFIHYETLNDVYQDVNLRLTRKRPALEDTVTTDDRFFTMERHDTLEGHDRFKLINVATDQWLSVGSGFTSARPVLRPMTSGPSDVDLFFIEKTLIEI